ncbi:MAG: TonB-dependent hemoglobin/transferrin/lactoferrin family receptor, partial [Rhodospirillales bacterium]|nr:TonB-dependent hemoglobin/transferrin/lactoferrin family receptor [Rhodospirillales bacterium]
MVRYTTTHTRGALAGLMLATSVSAVMAQTAPPASSGAPITLDGIIVTFSKSEEAAIDALSGSSAVGRSTLDQQFQPNQVSQVLRTLPGITTSETARDTATAVNIRGLQDFGRVNVLIEGARQNFQRSGHSANGVFYIEPEMIGSIDVTRGPTATVYGSGAIGGVVAFELLDADDILKPGEYAAVRSRTSYGSNGDRKLASGTGAVRIGNFDAVVQGNGRWADDYEDGSGRTVLDSGEATKSAYGKLRWRPLTGHEITLTALDYNAAFVDRQLDASNDRRDTAVNNSQFTAGYTFKSPDTPLIDLSAKVYRNLTGLDQTRLDTTSRFDPVGSQRSFDIVTEGVDVFNTSRFQFGMAKLAVTIGGDAFEDRVQTNDRTGSADEFTPGGTRRVSGAFSSALLTVGMFDLIGAVRYDAYELQGATVSLEGERVSPKVTAGVTPIPGVTLFATYAEGYRAPAITETLVSGLHPPPARFLLIPNPNLRPEVAQTVEGGVNLKRDGLLTRDDRFRAKAVVFQNEVADFIGTEFIGGQPALRACGNAVGCFRYLNFANVTIDGVEFEGVYDARIWFVGVNAARIRGTDDATGAPLATIQADQITVTGGLRLLDDKLILGARGRFVDAQDRVPTGVPTADGYTVVDLFGEYEMSKNATLNINLDNVFDRTYVEYLNQSASPGFS